ncbi:uncharacterized protein DUF3870 [Pseudonocardia hierapolitana]|uniref:Uncharacterized protein DUF3870 n=2 Tax=Pseudonocardia hierapolitana TaxID=1128676 RepID=A0A561SWV7_9PSEU|nr:uncharacterized protein DUF3870 [Pseudonocardia hierapolitana]
MVSAADLELARPWCDAARMGPRASLIVVGYAKVPRTSGAHGAADLLAVSLRVDRETGTVIDVDSTAVSSVVRSWVADLLLGVDLSADISPVLAEIDESYLSNAAGSLKQAISDAWRRYASYRAH